jgi:hypothetical protein
VLVSPRDAARRDAAAPIRIRSFSQPQIEYRSGVPTVVEFDRAPFGEPSLSRASGRPTAFAWPSPARIGEEARRLALRTNAVEGVTGLSDLKSHLADVAPNVTSWRASSDSDDLARLGPMIGGPTLALLLDGSAIGDDRASSRPSAIDQRFSRSALMGFFLAELIMHACVQLNAPSELVSGQTPAMRAIARIVLTANVSTTEAERQLLLERARTAVDMIWNEVGPHASAVPMLTLKPEVTLGVGVDLGAQMLFVANEVETTFKGNFRQLAGLLGAPDAPHGGTDCVRVAAIEFGSDSTSLLIADYQETESGRATPHVIAVERWTHGTRQLVAATLGAIVMPAIERHLERCGISPARRFIEAILTTGITELAAEDPFFARRLDTKVLRPASEALLAIHGRAPQGLGNGFQRIALGQLVHHGHGRIGPLDRLLERTLQRRGSNGFSLADVHVEYSRQQLQALVREDYADVLRYVAAILRAQRFDLLLAHGVGARHPDLIDGLRELEVTSPYRVVVLSETAVGTAANVGSRTEGRNLGAVASMLAAYVGTSTQKPAELARVPLRIGAEGS